MVQKGVLILFRELSKTLNETGKLDILCLGTPAIAGDLLGPLVGTMLKEQMVVYDVEIIGTRDCPIVSSNYNDKLRLLRHGVHTLVVDAAIGTPQWTWEFGLGPLSPGSGKKLGHTVNLPPVGDSYIKGYTGTTLGEIVRCDLLLVYELATDIALALLTLLRNHNK